MKKYILLLFMITGFLQAQTYPVNPTPFGKITINTNVESTTATKISVQEDNNRINWLRPENIPISQPPHPINYSVTAPTLGAHLIGIDTRLGQIGQTTAGVTNRIYFTGDNTVVNAVTYFASNATGKGSTPSASPPNIVNGDDQKQYFTKDVIGVSQPANTISAPGTYSGQLSVMVDSDVAQERYTVELYKTNSLGVPISSGITGAPVGDLGVSVITILDSGILDLSALSVTNITVSGVLTEQLTLNTGERVRYHVSAAKVGTAGSNVTFTVYYGSNYSSYYDVPVTTTTDGVINKSTVTGLTTSDALDELSAIKENSANKQNSLVTDGTGIKFPTVDAINVLNSGLIHKTGEVLDYSTGFPPLLSQDEISLEIQKRNLVPESKRLPVSSTTLVGWGDSLTAGAGGGGNTWPASLSLLTAFNVIDKGVGGETSTQIKNRMVADAVNYDKSVIIWAGRNNYTAPATVKADIATMIATLGHDRYLVLGVINGNYPSEYLGSSDYNTIVALNNDLKTLYGEKYVPIRELLVSLHDGTPQGLLDASRDIVPYNLRSDDIHLTSAGYTIVAELLNQRLSMLFNSKDNYLQSKDFKYYLTSFFPPIVPATTSFSMQNGALKRWEFRREGAELGSTQGSNLVLSSYFDNGGLNSNTMTIFRYNGAMVYKFGTTPTVYRGYLMDVLGSIAGNTLIVDKGGLYFIDNNVSLTPNVPVIARVSDRLRMKSSITNNFTAGFNTDLLTVNRDFSYPNASGTFALISDLSAYASNLLTGFTPGAGTITGTDTVFQGMQKLAGNQDLKANLAGTQTFTGVNNFPTATAGTSTDQAATTKFVSDAIDTNVSIQKIVDNPVNYASVDSGNSSIAVLVGSEDDRAFEVIVSDGVSKTASINLDNNSSGFANTDGGNFCEVRASAGVLTITQIVDSGSTSITAEAPVSTTTWSTPAYSASGNYKYASQPKEYLVSALPTPTGSDSRFEIVTDALAPTYMTTIVGGGSVVCPVFWNGSVWVAN